MTLNLYYIQNLWVNFSYITYLFKFIAKFEKGYMRLISTFKYIFFLSNYMNYFKNFTIKNYIIGVEKYNYLFPHLDYYK